MTEVSYLDRNDELLDFDAVEEEAEDTYKQWDIVLWRWRPAGPITVHKHKHPLTGELSTVQQMAVSFNNPRVKGWRKFTRGNILGVTLIYADGCKQLITYEKEAKFNGHYK